MLIETMIKDHNISEELIASANKASGIINDSLFGVMNNCSQEEFKKYRLAVGHVLAEIFERIIKPLSNEHPKLDPLKKIEEKTAKSREDDIPIYDRDAPVIIERLYHIEKSDGKKSGMNISICKPIKSKDGNDDWYCTWHIASEFGSVRKKSFGIDAWQAFNNAVLMISANANKLVASKKIKWSGGDGLSLLPVHKVQ